MSSRSQELRGVGSSGPHRRHVRGEQRQRHQVVGHVNVALIFGLLQFVSTFVIAALYGRFANRKLDPLAHGLNAKYKRERRR